MRSSLKRARPCSRRRSSPRAVRPRRRPRLDAARPVRRHRRDPDGRSGAPRHALCHPPARGSSRPPTAGTPGGRSTPGRRPATWPSIRPARDALRRGGRRDPAQEHRRRRALGPLAPGPASRSGLHPPDRGRRSRRSQPPRRPTARGSCAAPTAGVLAAGDGGLPAGGSTRSGSSSSPAGRTPAGAAFVCQRRTGSIESADAGISWQLREPAACRRRRPCALAVAPTDPRTVYASLGGLGRWSTAATDGGTSWRATHRPAPHAAAPSVALVVASRSPRTL